jgi:peptide/nickel transport system substrate-binding protein
VSREKSHPDPFVRRITRRESLVGGGQFVAGLALMDFLLACSQNAGQPTLADTLTLGITTPDGPFTADPHLAPNYLSQFPIMWTIADNLYRRDLDSKVQPALATAWSVSADGLTWTLTLRSGVKMHDGSTFTARDVQTAINRILQNPSKYTGTFFVAFVRNVASVKVVDDLHISITTKQPYPTLITDMPAPIATDYYTKVGDALFSAMPAAGGPFKFASLETNQSFTFKRHEDFWDKSRFPNFKKLVMKVVPDESTRVAGLLTGDLDAIQGLGAQSVAQLSGNNKVKVLRVDNVGMGQLFLPSLSVDPGTPLRDVRVRQALLYAIDRASISKSLFNGAATVMPVAIPPNALGYDTSLQPHPYDPGKAKQLLTDAGQSILPITLNHLTSDSLMPGAPNVAQAIASYWKAVGINVTTNPIDPANLPALRRAGQVHGALLITSASSVYAELAFIGPVTYASTSANKNMAEPRLDAIINKLVVATDINQRAQFGTQFVRYMYDNLPALPLLGMPAFFAHGPKVDFKTQAVNGYILTWYLRAA